MMNDFDYDVYLKKRIASGDRHRKRGSKTKYCGLPSDNLSQAQWKKRNGEVKTMNLNTPMNWKQFKAMPNDLQAEYIQKYVDRFCLTINDFCGLFSVSRPTFNSRCKELHVDYLFSKGRRKTEEQAKAFEAWLHSESPCEQMEEGSVSVAAPEPHSSDAVVMCSKLDMEWSGDVDLIGVLQLLHKFADGKPMKLRIVAEK